MCDDTEIRSAFSVTNCSISVSVNHYKTNESLKSTEPPALLYCTLNPGLNVGILFTEYTSGSVSYTHLDVYKRQAQRDEAAHIDVTFILVCYADI